MLGFSWQNIDWVKWMPLEVLALLMLIGLIRIIRRLNRWKSINVSHVQIDSIPFLDTYLIQYSYKTIDLEINSNHKPLAIIPSKSQGNNKNRNDTEGSAIKKKNNKCLLYIPSLGGFSNRSNFLPKSFSLLGYNVIEIPRGKIKYYIDANQTQFEEINLFFERNHINVIVCFDFMIPIIEKLFLNKNIEQKKIDLLSKLNLIMIRPLFVQNPTEFTGKTIPFTLKWLNALKIKKFLKQIGLSDLKTPLQNSTDADEVVKKFDVFKSLNIIIPKSDFNKEYGKEILGIFKTIMENSSSSPNKTFFQFEKGDWDFYQNETSLIGLLSKIIDEGNRTDMPQKGVNTKSIN